jgi:hypothetical protein
VSFRLVLSRHDSFLCAFPSNSSSHRFIDVDAGLSKSQ